jgi:hypothetical protein
MFEVGIERNKKNFSHQQQFIQQDRMFLLLAVLPRNLTHKQNNNDKTVPIPIHIFHHNCARIEKAFSIHGTLKI